MNLVCILHQMNERPPTPDPTLPHAPHALLVRMSCQGFRRAAAAVMVSGLRRWRRPASSGDVKVVLGLPGSGRYVADV